MTQNEQDEIAHDQITKRASASRHTPEPWHASHHGDSVIIASESGWVSSYFKQQADMDRAVACVNAHAGMNPEAVKDEKRFESKLSEDQYLGSEWLSAITSIHSLLNGDGAVALERGVTTDSKSNCVLEDIYWSARNAAGFADETTAA